MGMPGDLVLRGGGEEARERVPGILIRIAMVVEEDVGVKMLICPSWSREMSCLYLQEAPGQRPHIYRLPQIQEPGVMQQPEDP